MSEILIKDMEMPKSCEAEKATELDCPLKNRCIAYAREVRKQVPLNAHPIDFSPEGCRLIALRPHGRLVDIDKMELNFKATVVNCIEKDPNRADQYKEAERLVLGILKRTHTVLPASWGK